MDANISALDGKLLNIMGESHFVWLSSFLTLLVDMVASAPLFGAAGTTPVAG